MSFQSSEMEHDERDYPSPSPPNHDYHQHMDDQPLHTYPMEPSHSHEMEWDPEALGQAFLNDESQADWSAVTNLDAFFCKVYTYYVEKGFWCMIVARITNLLTLAFTICFSTFLLLFIDWHAILFCESNCADIFGLRQNVFQSPSTLECIVFIYFGVFCLFWLWNLLSFFYTLRDALEMRSFYKDDLQIEDDDLVSLEWHYILESLVQVSARKKLCIVKDLTALDITNRILRKENYMIAMVNLDLFQFGVTDSDGRCNVMPYCCRTGRRRKVTAFGSEMKETRKVLRERAIPNQSSGATSTRTSSTATATQAAAAGLKNPLLTPTPHHVPSTNITTPIPQSATYSTFSSPTSASAPLSSAPSFHRPHHSSSPPSNSNSSSSSTSPSPSWWAWAAMGTTLEWNLKFCVLNSLFDHHFYLHPSNLGSSGVTSLKRRFRILGVANLILTPFIMLFMIIFFFLKHAEELHSKRTLFGPRQWCLLAQWKLREFNELPHFFERRLTLASVAAQQYMQQFPNTLISIIAQSIAYITGALVAILLLLTVTDSDMITHRIFERTLLWYLAVFSGILALSRSMIPDKSIYPAPSLVMNEVVKHTHYLPRHWRGRTHTSAVYKEFSYMYPSRLSMFLYEIMSVVVTPFVLFFCLPHSAERVVQFISTRTSHVSGVGHLCAYAMFDLDKHGDHAYSGIPTTTTLAVHTHLNNKSDSKYTPSSSSSSHPPPMPSLMQRQSSSGSTASTGSMTGGIAPFPLRLKNGKMEKSFLAFSMANPHWKPAPVEDGGSGRRFLEGLAETLYGNGLHAVTAGAELEHDMNENKKLRRSTMMNKSTIKTAATTANSNATHPSTTSASSSPSKLPPLSAHVLTRQVSLDSNTTEEEGFDTEEYHDEGDKGGHSMTGDDHHGGGGVGSDSYLLSQSDRHLIQSFADLVGMDPTLQSTLHPSIMMRQSSLGGGIGGNSLLGMSTMLGLNSRRPHGSPTTTATSRPYPPMQASMMRSMVGFGMGASAYNPNNSVLLQSNLGPSRFGGAGGLQGGLSASTLLHLDPQSVREGLMLSQADQQADLFALLEGRVDEEGEDADADGDGDDEEEEHQPFSYRHPNAATSYEPDFRPHPSHASSSATTRHDVLPSTALQPPLIFHATSYAQPSNPTAMNQAHSSSPSTSSGARGAHPQYTDAPTIPSAHSFDRRDYHQFHPSD